ncbi:hypothetical protein [Cellulomonas carbonis]|uniref:DUF5666 domain-containing protein n=1 Tax=Cellulomonas carbonis T26 TaxID=947969 RepID=A0A0A0BN39_9CELL|nr:hypothetical protein [Cellulomonas carbonis]KGM09315.1 hypothetical protein N868_02940 [Cellulomonas carbonis T26]GGC13278.1 hypothetical protein GCM10010972_28220 [Cellulomonas carbonis]
MTTRRTKALAAPIALAAAVALTGCSDDSAGPEEGTTVEDVAEADPDEDNEGAGEADAGDDLIGESVTVSGEVTEVVADGAFWLGAGGGLFEEGAPVVSASGDFADDDVEVGEDLVDSDTIVQVQGTVEEFVLEDFEEANGVDLDDDAYEELEGEAVIVADRVARLAGEDVTISGEVHEVLSTVAFRLVGAGWTVVVIDAEQAAVEPGDTVEITGTVRQMDAAELGDDYGLDLDDALYEEYEGELVLVADTVEPTGEDPATDEDS